MPVPGSIARRVDFLYTSPAEYPFATLYFTGSKIFNTVMRNHAQSLGYTLNEHGLSYVEKGTKGKPVDAIFKDESDIFTFLGMKYKEPKDRIDGRSVQFLDPAGEKVLISTVVEETSKEKEKQESTKWERPERIGKTEIFKQLDFEKIKEKDSHIIDS